MRASTKGFVLTLGVATAIALLAPSPASAAPAADVSIAAEAHPLM